MRGKYKFYIWIVGFVSMFLHGKTDAQQALYPLLEKKSWSQVLEENEYKWHPPYTINLLIHPLHSSDWIYLNPSMVVSRRHVIRNISSTNFEQRKKAAS